MLCFVLEDAAGQRFAAHADHQTLSGDFEARFHQSPGTLRIVSAGTCDPALPHVDLAGATEHEQSAAPTRWRPSSTGLYHLLNPLHPSESLCTTSQGLDRPIRLTGRPTDTPPGKRCKRCLKMLDSPPL